MSKTEGGSVAKGYYYGHGYGRHSWRYRVRWSMHTHSLVPGNLYYSPYAPGHGGTGLIDGHVRYSPYAFGGGRSGLVSDEGVTYSCGFNDAPTRSQNKG